MLVKHPVFYRDESFSRFVDQNFQVVFSNFEVENTATALKVADLVIFGERHNSADWRLHNRAIQQILTYDTGVLLEESSAIQFIPKEGLPDQLKFLNYQKSPQLNIHGWDDPMIKDMMEQMTDKLIEYVEEDDGFENENTQRILDIVNAFVKEIPDENLQKNPDVCKQIFSVLDYLIDNARMYRELNNLRFESYYNYYTKIRNAIAFTKEIWKIRSVSLINSVESAFQCYRKIIIVGGKGHFVPDLKETVGTQFAEITNETYKQFASQFRDHKVIVLFTPSEVEEEESDISSEKSLILDQFMKNRLARSAIQDSIFKIIHSNKPAVEIREELKRAMEKAILIFNSCLLRKYR